MNPETWTQSLNLASKPEILNHGSFAEDDKEAIGAAPRRAGQGLRFSDVGFAVLLGGEVL